MNFSISLLEDQFKKGYYDSPSENSMYVYNTHVNNKVNQSMNNMNIFKISKRPFFKSKKSN